tara:strand:- start:29 stop:205 length:177 start_codon:yes stop_codon:yes gene_type:complete
MKHKIKYPEETMTQRIISRHHSMRESHASEEATFMETISTIAAITAVAAIGYFVFFMI